MKALLYAVVFCVAANAFADIIDSESIPAARISFRKNSEVVTCAGGIVSDHWIVVPTHCINHADDFMSSEGFVVSVYSAEDKEEDDPKEYRGIRMIKHPGYKFYEDGVSQNDVSLIEIQPKFEDVRGVADFQQLSRQQCSSFNWYYRPDIKQYVIMGSHVEIDSVTIDSAEFMLITNSRLDETIGDSCGVLICQGKLVGLCAESDNENFLYKSVPRHHQRPFVTRVYSSLERYKKWIDDVISGKEKSGIRFKRSETDQVDVDGLTMRVLEASNLENENVQNAAIESKEVVMPSPAIDKSSEEHTTPLTPAEDSASESKDEAAKSEASDDDDSEVTAAHGTEESVVLHEELTGPKMAALSATRPSKKKDDKSDDDDDDDTSESKDGKDSNKGGESDDDSDDDKDKSDKSKDDSKSDSSSSDSDDDDDDNAADSLLSFKIWSALIPVVMAFLNMV